jgi:hypothetical protein
MLDVITRSAMVVLYCPCKGKPRSKREMQKRKPIAKYICLQAKERLPMMMSEVIETVSKKPIPAHQKAVIVEVSDGIFAGIRPCWLICFPRFV